MPAPSWWSLLVGNRSLLCKDAKRQAPQGKLDREQFTLFPSLILLRPSSEKTPTSSFALMKLPPRVHSQQMKIGS